MITTTAIIFIILWFRARKKRDQYLAENQQLKMEINRLNQVISELKNKENVEKNGQISENN